MGGYRANLEVSDMHIRKEYESGKSIYNLSKKYNATYNTIKVRIINSGGKIIKTRYTSLWNKSEDNILIALREDGYSSRDISYGLFHRSLSAVCNRALILRRDRKVV